MTVRLDHRAIHLDGDCHVEDAEPLLNLLLKEPGRAVDISALGSIHTALLQLLLAFGPNLVGSNGDRFFERWITPLLVPAENE
jgi:hypothetical protein